MNDSIGQTRKWEGIAMLSALDEFVEAVKYIALNKPSETVKTTTLVGGAKRPYTNTKWGISLAKQ